MPPVPIYTASPINTAAKADGVTPQTAEAPPPSQYQPTTTTATPSSGAPSSYPPAQPGANPSLPLPTGAAASQRYAPVQPTPTQKSNEDQGPPAPQPGAAPVPPGARKAVPTPPRDGEEYHPPAPTPAPQLPRPKNVPYPAQMSIPAPTAAYSQRGTSAAYPQPPSHLPGTGAAPAAGPSYYEHPPGYVQDPNASDLTSNQRAAQEASIYSQRVQGSNDADEPGVWDTAKRLAQVAGEKLSAAENEVWRRINKE